MEAIRWITNIILVVCSIALIVLVLMQKGKGSGLGSAFGGGGAENFFGKQKSQGREAKLSRYTQILGGIIAVLSVALVLLIR